MIGLKRLGHHHRAFLRASVTESLRTELRDPARWGEAGADVPLIDRLTGG